MSGTEGRGESMQARNLDVVEEARARFRAWAASVPSLRPEDVEFLLDPMLDSQKVINLLLAAAINRLADVLERQEK
jgi:hypothetical protein